jgi:hypothetical protein
MSEETQAVEGAVAGQPIVARAGAYYRRARYLVCGMIFIFGLWFGYDGFVRWPDQLQQFQSATLEQQTTMVKPHNQTDINLQKALAVGLVPLSIVLLVFFLYRSRGEYRLEGHTLYVPGHPPVPLDRITELDRSHWDRKGILFVHYALTDGAAIAKLKLDDFVYERRPTDAIVAALTGQLFPAEASEGERHPVVDEQSPRN